MPALMSSTSIVPTARARSDRPTGPEPEQASLDPRPEEPCGCRDRAELVRQSDVLIENFRPGTIRGLGLGPDELLGADPRLVYCSLPGFGSTDRHAGVAGWEGILHAATAGYRPLNEHWDPTGRVNADVSDRTAPLATPITTASNFGGMLGAFAIVAALIARERTGRGQRVELPLVEAMAEAYSTMLGHHVYDDTALADNQMLRDITHRCQDGGLVDCSPWPKFVIGLLRGAGVADYWAARGLIDLGPDTRHLDSAGRFKTSSPRSSAPAPQAWEDVAMSADSRWPWSGSGPSGSKRPRHASRAP